MFNFTKTSSTSSTAVSGKLVIRDLDGSSKDLPLTSQELRLRELGEEEILFVAGGMRKVGRTTCSGGCADDCG